MTRRQWLTTGVLGGAAILSGAGLLHTWQRHRRSAVAIVKASNYLLPLEKLIVRGLLELGIDAATVKDKRILLKPNLVEVDSSAPHVNTHPALVRAAVTAFRRLGAASVIVAEGSGHCLDTLLVFEESGLREVLATDRTAFVDLNYQDPWLVKNRTRFSTLPRLAFPRIFRETDWIVSMPKMKTHHWAGVTLSMKNLFGVMPGSYYGWPKNVLHQAGLNECIADIALNLRPQLAIVDGIVGMEGDGPIMGDPVDAGVIVMGTDLPAVDATCARIMDVDPARVQHLHMAGKEGFAIDEARITQVGESIESVRRPFRLLPHIAAQQNLRS
ncbi:MAG TPA: DUF362 domain-containing protein [Verrucomicrobiae bacterium]|nr:DUF362 domain-containing protein [Verrucomicrobiae bacterium]